MGLRGRLPLASTPQQSAATLAAPLQRAQAPQRDRRPAADQPRSQPPWAGQLATPWIPNGMARPRRKSRLLAFGSFAAATLAAYVAHITLGLGGSGLDWVFNDFVYNGLMLAAARL